jgi:hypothetical protein
MVVGNTGEGRGEEFWRHNYSNHHFLRQNSSDALPKQDCIPCLHDNRKPSQGCLTEALLQGQILLAYLPTTHLSHVKNQAQRRRILANLFHAGMRRVLYKLKEVGVTGIPMQSGDGIWRHCHPSQGGSGYETRSLLDFLYLTSYPVQSKETLVQMETVLADFHRDKDIFCQLGMREHFNLPKLHSLIHYTAAIRCFGTTDNYNTETTERLHIDFDKDAYRASNWQAEG